MSIPQKVNHDNPSDSIIRSLVKPDRRLGALPFVFGKLGLIFESKVYDWMESLTADYKGGYWEFYHLSNGGFYMAPKTDQSFHMVNPGNYFEGNITADAAGIAVCLMALSHLSFDHPESVLADRFHQLRDFVHGHVEAASIFRLID